MITLRGTVKRILFQRETFWIFKLSVDACSDTSNVQKNIGVTGNFFGLNVTTYMDIELYGNWKQHDKYGTSLEVCGWKPWFRDRFSTEQFLTVNTSVFRGRRSALSDLLNKYLCGSLPEVLSSEKIFEGVGSDIRRRELETAQILWRRVLTLASLPYRLLNYGLSGNLITVAISQFGEAAEKVVTSDPYRLMMFHEASFVKLDFLASKLDIPDKDFKRLKGGIIWLLRDQRGSGHLFVRTGSICSNLSALASRENIRKFSVSDSLFNAALQTLEDEDAIKVVNGVGVYQKDLYEYEFGSAKKLREFFKFSESTLDLDLISFVEEYEKDNGIKLSDLQIEAITVALSNKVLTVSGAPGTGKTTLVKVFVRLFERLHLTYQLMAPTGIAAKRLSLVTGQNASTIHRALRFDGIGWGHHSGNPLSVDAVVVDELSMVDQELFYRLLSALDPTTILIFVGDDAQLPSVGAGNVLRELLSSTRVPSVRLETVFRQETTSDIVLVANSIRKGDNPFDLPSKEDSEFRFVPVANENVVSQLIVKMAEKLKNRKENFQVISAKYAGDAGVDRLNAMLQESLNSSESRRVILSDGEVRVGDRLMVIRNDYGLKVYNGDICKLESVGARTLKLRVYDGGEGFSISVSITEAFHLLKLAYAVTVHRCQGEEFGTVIMPIVPSQGIMLQRNLLYTAITRARGKVWLLGDSSSVLRAVGNGRARERNTILSKLLAVGSSEMVGVVEAL